MTHMLRRILGKNLTLTYNTKAPELYVSHSQLAMDLSGVIQSAKVWCDSRLSPGLRAAIERDDVAALEAELLRCTKAECQGKLDFCLILAIPQSC
jgi:hypothetical protein